YDDMLTCSAAAASMGGSQIWLEEGEVMSVNDLLKAVVIVSANDACAMLAEYVSGSIESFVARMNERAAELGMENTKFLDSSGLNDAAYSCALDVAVMSRELMTHKKITAYTTVWMDTLRNGESGLVNTNRLIRHYSGATGLKTGTTAAAGHCLSATAERDGLALVSVILGCQTTDERFGGARKMLDYGFANYAIYTPSIGEDQLGPVRVLHGTEQTVTPVPDDAQPLLIKKGQENKITAEVVLPADIEAPVLPGQVIGRIRIMLDGKELAARPLRADREVERMTFWRAFGVLLWRLCG
ncbi:MAG: D-alanyl-D-alanine carboxypeptidase, partial [Oscillospiraceae bacterium]|nr:D-alanyl-D-alanine carboxypeptidase [Oscillospiraceae bacterium]